MLETFWQYQIWYLHMHRLLWLWYPSISQVLIFEGYLILWFQNLDIWWVLNFHKSWGVCFWNSRMLCKILVKLSLRFIRTTDSLGNISWCTSGMIAHSMACAKNWFRKLFKNYRLEIKGETDHLFIHFHFVSSVWKSEGDIRITETNEIFLTTVEVSERKASQRRR